MNVLKTGETQKRHQVLRSQRGATAIEFALILPILASLIFGDDRFWSHVLVSGGVGECHP